MTHMPYTKTKKNKKKIAHIITGLNIGGAERALHTLLTGGLEEIYSNHVISLLDEGHYGPLLREREIRVTPLYMTRRHPTLRGLVNLKKVINEQQPDIIQGWMYHGNILASLLRPLIPRKVGLLWNVRTSLDSLEDMSRNTKWAIKLSKFTSRQPNYILYNSKRSSIQHSDYGFYSQNSLVVPNAFDLLRWRPSPEARKRLRASMGCDEDVPIIGFVGRDNTMKDLPNLFLALKDVLNLNKEVVFVLVGANLKKCAPVNFVSRRTIFLDHRDDISDLMATFDILCLSSRAEGFPNVIGEAMATGIPCVATDVGDVANIVGDTGWIVPPRESGALAKSLLQALNISREERRALGSLARERIQDLYSIESIVQQYQHIYESLFQK